MPNPAQMVHERYAKVIQTRAALLNALTKERKTSSLFSFEQEFRMFLVANHDKVARHIEATD